MTTEPETAEEEEDDTPLEVGVEPPGILQLGDQECSIYDPDEFAELTESIAVQYKDGQLYVLKRATMKWESIEQKTSPTVRSFKR